MSGYVRDANLSAGTVEHGNMAFGSISLTVPGGSTVTSSIVAGFAPSAAFASADCADGSIACAVSKIEGNSIVVAATNSSTLPWKGVCRWIALD